MMVKEEDEDRIVLTDRVAGKVICGSALIIFGLYCSQIFFFLIFDGSVFDGSVFGGLVGVLFGGLLLFGGLHILLVKESVIIDKRLQSAIIIEKSSIKYFRSIKKISFVDIRRVEITYNTYCEKCNYNSPSTSILDLFLFDDSWDVSLITSDDGSIQIYDGGSKSKAEKIAENICRITSALVRHQTNYIPPNIV